MRFLVVGGQQEEGVVPPGESARYRSARILELDAGTGEIEPRVEHRTPPTACPEEDASVLFKAGTLVGDDLYVCTQTEVQGFSLPDFSRTFYFSHPWLNDCHHVRPTARGTLHVLSTGLDLVLEMTTEGEVVREWSVIDDDPWNRFRRDVDYRKVPSTKPHGAHANFLVSYGGDLWVTRFHQKDVRRVTGSPETIPFDAGAPHDGIVDGGRVYFTTVNGRIVVVDLEARRLERVVDLEELSPTVRELGWCRGITVVSENVVLVGFGRIRPTRWSENLVDFARRENLRRYGFEPTRVACYDLEAEELLWEKVVEEHGLDAIFSIHVLEPESSADGSGSRTELPGTAEAPAPQPDGTRAGGGP